ncbi:hypothetical protein ACI3KY_03155 [Microbacterium sp. ZW T2_14]|uniref:hypothetical protein n=1 Tax=Microbacterium sp. ZW T2_14 TaxID=3378079 RepID=UPI003854C785
MVYEERNIWASLIAGVVGVAVYVILVLQQAGGGPLTEVDWVPLMLWTIGGSIVAAIVISIVWGMLAGLTDPEGVGKSDQRDRDIAHMSTRVGQAFLVIAGLGVIVLCAFEADWFWIANCMFLGFAVSSIIGGVASVVAYRRGLV